MSRTLIIAEAGVNHNGDLEMARELVRAAARAGADIVKFQTFVTEKSISRDAPKAGYQTAATGSGETQYEMVKKLELSRADHDALIAECADAGIRFWSTAFDDESINMLIDLGIDMLKIPSGELTNLPFLRDIGRRGLPVIMSTGMATLDEIGDALAVLEGSGLSREDVTILHCNTEYPTPMDDVNLKAMQAIASEFGTRVGYSDHTQGIEVPIAAVALGAKVIEKHFTLDRALPGPDHLASLEPDELTAMVSAIRNIERATAGDGIKAVSPSEADNRRIARKSIVAARAIAAGETLGPDNLAIKRPGTGISPMRWDNVVGTMATRDFAADEPIEL